MPLLSVLFAIAAMSRMVEGLVPFKTKLPLSDVTAVISLYFTRRDKDYPAMRARE